MGGSLWRDARARCSCSRHGEKPVSNMCCHHVESSTTADLTDFLGCYGLTFGSFWGGVSATGSKATCSTTHSDQDLWTSTSSRTHRPVFDRISCLEPVAGLSVGALHDGQAASIKNCHAVIASPRLVV